MKAFRGLAPTILIFLHFTNVNCRNWNAVTLVAAKLQVNVKEGGGGSNLKVQLTLCGEQAMAPYSEPNIFPSSPPTQLTVSYLYR